MDKSGHPASMPFALFWSGGCAYHAGDPNTESHGCIHLRLEDAEWLFNWVGHSDVHVKCKAHDPITLKQKSENVRHPKCPTPGCWVPGNSEPSLLGANPDWAIFSPFARPPEIATLLPWSQLLRFSCLISNTARYVHPSEDAVLAADERLSGHNAQLALSDASANVGENWRLIN